MTNTRNQEIDSTLKELGKAISNLQETLATMLKQQEQSMKQQEEILQALKEHSSGGRFSGGGGGPDKGLFSDESRTGTRPIRVGKVEFPRFSGEDVEDGLQPEDVKITPSINASKLPLLPDPTGVPGPPAYKPATINAKRLSGEELELKKSKGECFWCTEKFVPGHKCKKKQLFVINVEGDEETEQDDKG
ncbi:hypothetical protein HanIR_Chr16g0836501 [Helianthus annuus]|nr:hypothetical protein HanIR_Chr16g0836501 [Helianthus annuus]